MAWHLPHPEDISIWGRIALVIAIVVVILVLFMAVDVGGEPKPASSPYEERFVQLDREAIEKAYVEHMIALFSVWVKDYSDAPPRAVKGAANARNAYTRAMTEIDRRDAALQRRPP